MTLYTNTGCPLTLYDGDPAVVGELIHVGLPGGSALALVIAKAYTDHSVGLADDPLVPDPVRLYFDLDDCPDVKPQRTGRESLTDLELAELLRAEVAAAGAKIEDLGPGAATLLAEIDARVGRAVERAHGLED